MPQLNNINCPSNFSSDSNVTCSSMQLNAYSIALIAMYSAVLIGGITGAILMICILKSNIKSVTTTAVLNLIAIHVVFLLTVPFRMYYYASNNWSLGPVFCKVVSAMIHAHLYIAFIFYVTILVIRYLMFFQKSGRVEFYRKLHALGYSAAVWAVILIIVLPAYLSQYGNSKHYCNTTCFHFQGELENSWVRSVNYTVIAIVLTTVSVLFCCQLYILWKVVRQHRAGSFAHQEFWAQIKSLSFVLVMIICFVPYHMFRIYYLQHVNDSTYLYQQNEVYLALTALSCFDLLTFLGRGSYLYCPCTSVKSIFPCC
ncbi:probable G-protein coupled receptor 141 [Polyodon spathula]|uniref:probable G-protein coupled receptor 141 n=1 Tax=Polyodon spathula TaxID=7913 RepID=UPI001B7DF9B9|nr:probable G-protein coupled receptor 141 [Polyodon spathula]